MRNVLIALAMLASTAAVEAKTFTYSGSINGSRYSGQTFIGRDGQTSSFLRYNIQENDGINDVGSVVTEPNACDRKGRAGFEVVSGPRPGCDR